MKGKWKAKIGAPGLYGYFLEQRKNTALGMEPEQYYY